MIDIDKAPSTPLQLPAEVLIEVLKILREYPDFDDPNSPYAAMIDQALNGVIPDLLRTVDSISSGQAPSK